jgi:2-iminobutanoate/2-iminopropanoate deaminase
MTDEPSSQSIAPTGRTVIRTDAAPAVGPYSQAIRAGGWVFTAGQIGVDPATGQLVAGGVAAQTHRALQNVRAVLAAAGATLESVVKTTVFLTDMSDFRVMNEVYREHFGADPPARSTVGVAALPLEARVEIEAVAVVPE